MSDGSDTVKQSTPWHLWVIGAVSLLWNGFGGFDYVMTKTRNEAYLEPFTEEQLEFFFNFPLIANIGWGLGVWMSILGSILLLLRSKWAFQAFRLSLLGLIITTIYSYFIANGLEITKATGAVFSVIIFVIAVGLYFYSHRMANKGVLR